MKRSVLIIFSLCLLVSCTEETPKSCLLEFKINDNIYSYEGFAYRYNDIVKGISKACDWHIFNLDKNAIYIQAYDTTFQKYTFPFPAFQAKYTDESSLSQVKTYEATSGQFRILKQQMGDVAGDFYFTLKNIINPNDSVVIKEGYFTIWIEKHDRIVP